MRLRSFDLGGKLVTEACHERDVPLAGLSERLRASSRSGSEPTLVGGEHRRAAVLGALPDPQMTNDEVRAFVAGLVASGSIAYDEPARKAAARRSTRRGRGAVTGQGRRAHARRRAGAGAAGAAARALCVRCCGGAEG